MLVLAGCRLFFRCPAIYLKGVNEVMKRWYIVTVIALVMVGMLAGLASANPGIYEPWEMPEPPPMPSWANGYYVVYNEGPTGTGIHDWWTIYFVNDPDKVVVKWSEPNQKYYLYPLDGLHLLSYSNMVRYDSDIPEYYFTDWVNPHETWTDVEGQRYPLHNVSSNSSEVYPYGSFDFKLTNGEVYMALDPIPPCPLIGKVNMEMIPETVGGIAIQIIPVGLVVLLMLLLVALIRYLLRSLALKIK